MKRAARIRKEAAMNLAPRFRRFTSRITLAVVGVLLCANGLQAKEEPPAFEVEPFRGELLETVDAYQDLAARTPLGSSNLAVIENARKRIENASPEDLAALNREISDLSMVRATAQELRARVARQPQGGIANRTASVLAGGEDLPSASYSFCGSNRHDSAVMAASEAALFTAETVREEASRACDETVVILGEGGNGSLVCLITDAIYIVAKAANQALAFCDGDIDSAEIEGSYDRLAHIHDNLETSIANDNANTTAINGNVDAAEAAIIANANANRNLINANTNSRAAEIIANDNANRDAIIANANANKNELRDLILRTQIEADLATADNAVPLALYLTPGSVCSGGQCGRLDLVREVVARTLANIQASGESIGGAQKLLDQGDALMASGQFKAAYQAFRKAYKAALK
jgi:Holliday junction resolvasome RuvABC endonuclease subunit